eukprot:1470894-Amphidinium_carterae.1
MQVATVTQQHDDGLVESCNLLRLLVSLQKNIYDAIALLVSSNCTRRRGILDRFAAEFLTAFRTHHPNCVSLVSTHFCHDCGGQTPALDAPCT